MNKIIFTSLTGLMMLLASCSKDNNNNNSSNLNNWSFRGTTYGASSCTNAAGTYTAISTSPYGTLYVTFYDSIPAAGSYHVEHGQYASSDTQVCVTLFAGTALNPLAYYSTNDANQKVNVSVSTAGKVSITGTGITMIFNSSPYDSAYLTLNITQTQ